METRNFEFLKLDDTDRKVLFWLIANVHPNSVKSWIEFVEKDYKRRHGIRIDCEKLYEESYAKDR
jgi:hypothetical protein